jgi:hypothetical protein
MNCAQSQDAADAPVGNVIAGTSDNIRAINSIVDVNLIFNFMRFSSSPSIDLDVWIMLNVPLDSSISFLKGLFNIMLMTLFSL